MGFAACHNKPAPESTSAAAQVASGPPITPSRQGLSEPVEAEMRNVAMDVGSGMILRIVRLRGELLSTEPGIPPTFDTRTSYDMRIYAGSMRIDAASLANLMNEYTFAYPGAPLRDLAVKINGGRLQIKGGLEKGIRIPFELEGTPSATGDGLVRLHTTGIRSAHLPVKGLMDLLGVRVTGLLNGKGSRGVSAQGDDLLLDPEGITPPPHIQGRVTTARVEGADLVLVFGGEDQDPGRGIKRLAPPLPDRHSYMYFRGGLLRFGKLTMRDADLEITGAGSADYFEFNLDQYNRQLVAGYSRNTPAYGLIVFMPDFRRLASETSSPR